MSLIHDIIKIKYIELGYLPDQPYHLISDAEMCDAFIHRDDRGYSVYDPVTQHDLYSDDIKVSGYFVDNYNLEGMKTCKQYFSMQQSYVELVRAMLHYTSDLRSSFELEYVLPNWMYQFMIGSVIHSTSPEKDRHDSLVLFEEDNIDDEFTPEFYDKVFMSSKYYIDKLPRTAVRLSEGLSSDLYQYPDVIQETQSDESVAISLVVPVPSPFVTPSTVKYARLLELEPNSDEVKDQRYKYLDLPNYVVSYDPNGGNSAPANQIKYQGYSIYIPQAVPRRRGYVFKEWNTKSDGSGIAYQPRDEYTDDSNLLLYAQWRSDQVDAEG